MFEVDVSEVEDVVIFKLRGRFNAQEEGRQFLEIFRTKSAEGKRKFVINCEQPEYISSPGISLLLVAFKDVRAISGYMKLCGLKERVRYCMYIPRQHPVFDIHESCEDALSELLAWSEGRPGQSTGKE